MRPSRSCLRVLSPCLTWLLGLVLLVWLSACGPPAPSDHASSLESHASLGGPSESPPVSLPSPSLHHAPVTPAASRAPAGHTEAQPAAPLIVPEWMATALTSPDVQVRLQALDRWVQQGHTGAVDPLMVALNDADERVRTRALQLIEQDWMRGQATH